MVFRSIVAATILSVATLASAQTTADAPATPETLRQVTNFENVLTRAVEQAATRVVDRALQAVPDFKLRLDAPAFAKGFVMPNGEGMFFIVEVPGIEGTSEMLWNRYRQLQTQPQQGIANTAPPALGPASLMTNPGKEYSDYTHQGLVDGMLDFALALPLKEGQTLSISVGATPDPSNPLASGGRRLYLTIKADDLIALRANRITRDEAKTRIIERRY